MKKMNSLWIGAVFLVMSGCAAKPMTPAHVSQEQKKLSPDQRQLNYGYAIVYKAFKDLQWADKVLLVKKESDAVDNIVKDIDGTSKKFQNQFEELQKKYPNLKLDDTGRPNVLEMKNKDQSKDKFISYAPIVGKKGADFERALMLHLSGAMNELKYLSQELQKMEPNQGLKDFMFTVHNETLRLEDRMLKLLNEKYFKQNFFKAQEPEKK